MRCLFSPDQVPFGSRKTVRDSCGMIFDFLNFFFFFLGKGEKPKISRFSFFGIVRNATECHGMPKTIFCSKRTKSLSDVFSLPLLRPPLFLPLPVLHEKSLPFWNVPLSL